MNYEQTFEQTKPNANSQKPKAKTMNEFINTQKVGNQNINGETTWKSPSNIALVKYWGKYGRQMPANASVSFTLENAFSKTTLKYKNGTGKVVLFFEGEKNEAFGAKIEKFMQSVEDINPFYQELDFEISSTNSFPHSAGIASSASAMSALCMGLCEIENKLFANLSDKDFFLKKASYLSRFARLIRQNFDFINMRKIFFMLQN